MVSRMKLTNTIRDAFIRAALDDVPSVDYTEQIRRVAFRDLVGQLPAAVRKLWDDTDLRQYIKTAHGSYGGVSINYPADNESWNRSKPLTDKAAAIVEDLHAKSIAQDKTRSDLRDKLRSAAYACTTRKALVDLLPEFEQYLPADEAKAQKVNLPAVANILADFVNAGWPKGKAA